MRKRKGLSVTLADVRQRKARPKLRRIAATSAGLLRDIYIEGYREGLKAAWDDAIAMFTGQRRKR